MERMEVIGIAAELGMEFVKAYRIRRLSTEHADSREDPLLVLLDDYDLSDFRVGGIRFAQPPIQNGNRLEFADIDADPLCYDLTSREITFCDHEAPGFVMQRVAADGASFLSALAIASGFLTSRLLEETPLPAEADAQGLRCAQRCAQAAGGEAYFDFYCMFIGVDISPA